MANPGADGGKLGKKENQEGRQGHEGFDKNITIIAPSCPPNSKDGIGGGVRKVHELEHEYTNGSPCCSTQHSSLVFTTNRGFRNDKKEAASQSYNYSGEAKNALSPEKQKGTIRMFRLSGMTA